MQNSQAQSTGTGGSAGAHAAFSTFHSGVEEAQQLAKMLVLDPTPRSPRSPLKRLPSCESRLNEVYTYFSHLSSEKSLASHSADWLLDNFYLVEQTLRQIAENMPKGFYQILPKIKGGNFSGYARVYVIAGECFRCLDGKLNVSKMEGFLRSFQSIENLTIAELWAFPALLRFCVIETLTGLLAEVGFEGGASKPELECINWLKGKTTETPVAECILTLRALEIQDWKPFFERFSKVSEILTDDPAGMFHLTDFETRDRCIRAVEELARRTGLGEEAVANRVIEIARQDQASSWSPPPSQGEATSAPGKTTSEDPGSDTHAQLPAHHVGFYLLGDGRAKLEAELGYRPPLRISIRRWLVRHATPVYLGSIGILEVGFLVSFLLWVYLNDGSLITAIIASLALLVPTLTAAVAFVNSILTCQIPPRILPKLDFKTGIPPQYPTLVVVPAIVRDELEVEFLLRQLELNFLANRDPLLSFALLVDFRDAPEQRMPGDRPLFEKIEAGIRTLNEKYGKEGGLGPFLFLHRHRKWNPCERLWMGWERKRGKLMELNRLILGSDETSYNVDGHDLEFLRQVKYVITLDADTILPRAGAKRLVGTLAHPLNRAEFDPTTGTLVGGYSIIQPRVTVSLSNLSDSVFSKVFAPDAGVDLYTRAVSDVYQDLFGEGIYVGKGIYDVAAFQRALEGRVPECALLSHDLFEGLLGRAALASDIVVYEDYPTHYFALAHRLQRWVRGDWQLVPWLFPRVPQDGGATSRNQFGWIARWKILDNLRRSLVAPSLLALLILSWFWLPGSPWVWTLAALSMSAANTLFGIMTCVRRNELDSRSFQNQVVRWLLSVSFLVYESALIVRAVLRTVMRLAITRRNLLQWTTSSEMKLRVSAETLSSSNWVWRKMSVSPIAGLGVVALVALKDDSLLPLVLPFVLIWVGAPYIAHWISLPQPKPRDQLSVEEERSLRRFTRRTWLFFEHFVGPEDHWLPPDHYQETPRGTVAHRTSPTNIGLYLLSVLGAYDLGYIGLYELLLRLRSCLERMGELETFRGHFLNWYDTNRLEPLTPRYVSTVDSGNLAACLLALQQGCHDIADNPVLRRQQLEGLLDTVNVLKEELDAFGTQKNRKEVAAVQELLSAVSERILAAEKGNELERLKLVTDLSEDFSQQFSRLMLSLMESLDTAPEASKVRSLHLWVDALQKSISDLQRESDALLPWLSLLRTPPPFFSQLETDSATYQAWQELLKITETVPIVGEIVGVSRKGKQCLVDLESLMEQDAPPTNERKDAESWCEHLRRRFEFAIGFQEGILSSLVETSRISSKLFDAMDFRFLFDPLRQLFHLGYSLEAQALDSNHYDLLASEARIASFLSIAKGDVAEEHWMHLGRPLTKVDGHRILGSWTGTMFEYLMPTLLLRHDQSSLLGEAIRTAVTAQINYEPTQDRGWGISESGYFFLDANQNYQYRAFGVPQLGFKRGLEKDLVVSPYASMLALQFQPGPVIENLSKLVKLGLLGDYGFYEAVDFTPSRLPLGKDHAIVSSYMAHHQGMIFLSSVNFLLGDIMPQRLHADPRVQSTEVLLDEQMPRQSFRETRRAKQLTTARMQQVQESIHPWSASVSAPFPQCHCLSNGRYGVMITAAGGGYSRWQEWDLTRWHPDTTLDEWGTWIYIKDLETGSLWSASSQPTDVNASKDTVLFHHHKVEFRRQEQDIFSMMEIAVSPTEDAEIRRITLANRSSQTRQLEIISYGEVVLAPQNSDRRHPAFNKIFIESEYLADQQALLFWRRKRSSTEKPIFMAHMVAVEGDDECVVSYQSDRKRFLGRGNTSRSPAALSGPEVLLPGTTGSTLDPAMSLSLKVVLDPHSSKSMAFVSLAASSRDQVLAMIERHHLLHQVEETIVRSSLELESGARARGYTSSELKQVDHLLSLLLYPHSNLRAPASILASNRRGQTSLWAHGISGDNPIVLVRLGDEEETRLLHEILRAHAHWRRRQLLVDLVILNQQETGYGLELDGRLRRIIGEVDAEPLLNQRGGVFLLRADLLGDEDQILLSSAARVVLDGSKGSLSKQLNEIDRKRLPLPRLQPVLCRVEEKRSKDLPLRPLDLQFDNGLGGFTADGREYVIFLEDGDWTPAPWVNVIANPDFGCMVSESGGGYTWSENSGENRLTPWRNDPITDRPGEVLYLRDEETGEVFSPTKLPCGHSGPHLIRHGAGWSRFESCVHGLELVMTVFVVPDQPLKLVRLKVQNRWEVPRRVTATAYAEWVLGVDREENQQYLIPEFDEEHEILVVQNPYHEEFAGKLAFLAGSRRLHGFTADREEFLGRMGNYACPAGLTRIGLNGTVEAGLDPCGALQIHLDLPPSGSDEIIFLLGQTNDRPQMQSLVSKYRSLEAGTAALLEVHRFWDELLGRIQVETPDPAMNFLANRWLLYQSLSCRIWGRSALYQSSGAFGFRDQLQDTMALVPTHPEIAGRHIMEAARHQFEDGDVLHWWHPPSGRGVRTRCSDDLLWLPFATAHYVFVSGDRSILQKKVSYLKGDPLAPEEEERYAHWGSTEVRETIYQHCIRALKRGLALGPNGIPLIGSGDWNDGMNRVGVEGRGESVWLGWFLYAGLDRFALLCGEQGDDDLAHKFRRSATNLRQTLQQKGWDGNWYLRARYDDGKPIGSAQSEECQIDSIAQSWSVLSGAGDPGRMEQAMEAVAEKLVEYEDQLLLLFTPPFDKTPRDPGYIKGYPPGIRENGGQYTHAALWAVWAFAELGQGARAESLFRLLNPIYHGDTAEKIARYQVEPYVIAADVYNAPERVGQGGWTWYTGSAAWMYRLALEAILGLRPAGKTLKIEPCLPKHWAHYSIDYSYGKTPYRIEVSNPRGVNTGVSQVSLDGKLLQGSEIPLENDGRAHHVEVELG